MPVAFASFEAMHTRVEMVFTGLDVVKSEFLCNTVYEETLRLDAMLNRFDATSELSYVNAHAGKQPIQISEEMADVLDSCLSFHEATKGFFDVTVHSPATIPNGDGRYRVDPDVKKVTFMHPAVQIDLGGFAKGYALKKIQYLMFEQEIANYVLNFGNSSILAVGQHPYGRCWNIGVEHPVQKGKTIQLFNLTNQSLSISGNVPLHPQHIISPLTSNFITGLSMISVKGQSPLTAEILSTALFAAPANMRSQLLTKFPGYSACNIHYDAIGASTVTDLN